jgi:hypothetical protein
VHIVHNKQPNNPHSSKHHHNASNIPFPIEEDETTRSYAYDAAGRLVCFFHKLRFCMTCCVDFTYKKHRKGPKPIILAPEETHEEAREVDALAAWDWSYTHQTYYHSNANDSAVELKSAISVVFPQGEGGEEGTVEG